MESVFSDIRNSAISSSEIQCLSETIDRHVSMINDQVEGTTLLSCAVSSERFLAVDLLLLKGANPNISSRVFDPERGVWRLETPLITAARLGLAETVTTLVDHGAMVNAVDSEKGKSPLHWACAGNFSEMAKYLVHCGANVNSRDYYWEPPVVEAICRGDKPLVELLVFCGIKLNECLSNDRDTVLLLALLINQTEIAEFFIEAGAAVNALNRECEDAMVAVLTYCRSDNTTLHLCRKLIRAGFRVNDRHLSKAWNQRGASFFQLLKEENNNSLSLKNLCRTSLRRYLLVITEGRHILHLLERLPLPKWIINYLKLQHL